MANHSINYRYNSKMENAISNVIEYVLSKNYGDTIPFEKLSEMLGYNIEDEKEKKKFRSTMQRIRNYLIEKGYVLRSIVGVGYYIMKPKQISGYCYHTYVCKIDRLLGKAGRILEHTDKTKLSAIRTKEYNEYKQLNQDVKETVREEVSSSKYYANKQVYDSLND